MGTALASPASHLYSAKRQTATPDIAGAITQWNLDVQTVNTFLNHAIGQSQMDLLIAARNALNFASDEPNELMILAMSQGLADNALAAIQDLMNVFGNVPTAIQSVIDNPDAGNVATQVGVINQVRCCNVLPDLNVLWTAAAADAGVVGQVNLVVPLPNACNDGSVVCP
ncbi:hypothetical protein BCR34DRAFT_499814 [Clohesyomyces aquaticus]|uniref:Uncharacterized protein n=1 Tax=Clohesyomyces aquaticus TaxID=1231657 RepID=A0A1Y1Y6A0_9PLEO|nr:hypothetical protein BCR34DRAFT_499814 [Clohesyomyces aquaticus]